MGIGNRTLGSPLLTQSREEVTMNFRRDSTTVLKPPPESLVRSGFDAGGFLEPVDLKHVAHRNAQRPTAEPSVCDGAR